MFAMPTRQGWTLMADRPNANGAAFHKARREAQIPEDYRDKAQAEKNAEALSAKLGFKVHVLECIY